MNFKKLGSVLSKKKMLWLLTDNKGVQWAGDDIALYELSGLPEFTPETLLFVFGAKMADIDKWKLKDGEIPWGIDTSEELESDKPVVIDDNAIMMNGSTCILLHVGERCLWLPEKYLMPVYSNQMHLFCRTMPETGETKIIAREGLFVSAVFEPMGATDDMREWITKIRDEIE